MVSWRPLLSPPVKAFRFSLWCAYVKLCVGEENCSRPGRKYVVVATSDVITFLMIGVKDQRKLFLSSVCGRTGPGFSTQKMVAL
jgi:hypothetical protein